MTEIFYLDYFFITDMASYKHCPKLIYFWLNIRIVSFCCNCYFSTQYHIDVLIDDTTLKWELLHQFFDTRIPLGITWQALLVLKYSVFIYTIFFLYGGQSWCLSPLLTIWRCQYRFASARNTCLSKQSYTHLVDILIYWLVTWEQMLFPALLRVLFSMVRLMRKDTSLWY